MSEAPDPEIIDLRQATLGEMLRHLGRLTDAITRANDRYARLEVAVARVEDLLVKVDARLEAKLDAMERSVLGEVRETRIELVTLENQVLDAVQDGFRANLRLDAQEEAQKRVSLAP